MLTLLSFGLFYEPVIFSDDWARLIASEAFGKLNWFLPTSGRPFDLAFYKLLFTLFGLNLNAFYLVKVILTGLAAIQLYCLFTRFFPNYWYTGLAFAAVYLVYPVDQTRMWLTMLSPGWVLTLLYAWLLCEYMMRGKIGLLVGALVLFTLPLLEYEGQLGVALTWSLLLFFLSRKQNQGKWRFALLLPQVIGLGYALWKFYGPAVLHFYDRYAGRIQLQPLVLGNRLLRGMGLLVIGWSDPLRYWVRVPGLDPANQQPYLPDLLLLVPLVLVAIICGVLAGRITRKPPSQVKITPDARLVRWKTHGLLVLVGVTLALAGYFPVISIGKPRLELVPSRFNFFAVPGAALVFVGLVGLLAWGLASHADQVPRIVWGMTLPFGLVGVASQVNVQWEARSNWEEQKAILRGLLEAAPGLVDETMVVFVVPDYQPRRYAMRTPFVGNWEAVGVVQVLYNNQTLSAEHYMPDRRDLPQARFLPFGIENDPFSAGVTPYDQLLVVIWDASSRQVRVAFDLQKELGLPWQAPGYAPTRRILQERPIAPLRYLVDAASP